MAGHWRLRSGGRSARDISSERTLEFFAATASIPRKERGMPWDPRRYLTFGIERTRPALELLARVPHDRPRRVVDLGCGPGNSTRLLQDRWPDAHVTGVDSSAEMLAEARTHAGIRWQLADLGDWRPREPHDVVFSNAALHWLDSHATLFPRLMEALAPGGVLAVQMPTNFASASHRLVDHVASDGPWQAKLKPLLRAEPVDEPAAYYRFLAPQAKKLDIWQTEYLHVLEGDNPVADWTRGSLLVPLLAALEEAERSAFEAEYRRRVKAAYPPQADGKTLYPFKRLFIVAQA
jgi:trans-aconitate 2-methyltransferase